MRKTTEFEAFIANLTQHIKTYNLLHGTDYSVEPYAGTDYITVAFPTKKERWATKMAIDAYKAASRDELTINFQDRMTIVHSISTGKTGVAIRALCDKDDSDLGVAIAYCRAMCFPIPDFALK